MFEQSETSSWSFQTLRSTSQEKKTTKNGKIKRKRFWTPQEDRILTLGVQKYGNKRWSKISKLFKNRDAKRCRQRWFNYLNGEKQDSFNEEEKWLLFLAFKLYGNKWTKIGKILNRGDNIVKNKVNCLKRQGMESFEQRLQKIKREYCLSNNLSQKQRELIKELIAGDKNEQVRSVTDQSVNKCWETENYQENFNNVYQNFLMVPTNQQAFAQNSQQIAFCPMFVPMYMPFWENNNVWFM